MVAFVNKKRLPTSVRSTRRERLIQQQSVWIGLIVALVVIILWWGGLFTGARLRLNDLVFVASPASDTIRIIAIDDASFERYGRSLTDWSRSVFANVVTWLSDAGARVVTFDVLFVEESDDDETLAAAMRAARNSDSRLRTVLPMVGVQRGDIGNTNQQVQYQETIRPPRLLFDEADALGYINAYPDADNTIRRQLSLVDAENNTALSLALATYIAYLRVPSSAIDQVVTTGDKTVTIASSRTLQTDAFGLWMPNYFYSAEETSDLFPTDSLRAVLAGEIDAALYQDKIVFVGVMNSTALTDLYIVPTASSGRLTAGVELHANAVETLVQNNALSEQSQWAQVVIVLILAVGCSVIYGQVRWYWVFPVAILFIAGWVIIALVTFSVSRVVVDVFDALLALSIPAVVVLLAHFAREASARRANEFLLHSVVDVSQQRMAMDKVLPTIADDLRRLMPDSAGVIWLSDDDNKVQSVAHRWESTQASSVDETIARRAFASARLIHEHPQIAVPIVWQAHVLAVFSVTSATSKRVRAATLAMLQSLAEEIAPSLENARLYEALTRQKTLIEQSSEIKTQMIRMASHDLNNPLTNILVTAQLLLENDDTVLIDAKVRQSLERMQRSSEQMRQIIQDILSLERVRGAVVFKSAFDFGELVREVTAQEESDAEAKSQIVDIMIDDDLPPTFGDRQLLRQAVSNLIGNAVKYTPVGGSINITVRADIDRLCLEVEDTGYGIPEKDQRSIFREFFRAKSGAAPSIPGTGLGLSLVKAVAQAHGGRVWFRSMEGEGSTFFMEVPSQST